MVSNRIILIILIILIHSRELFLVSGMGWLVLTISYDVCIEYLALKSIDHKVDGSIEIPNSTCYNSNIHLFEKKT